MNRITRALTGAAAAALTLAASPLAHAETACTQDEECSKGFTCQVSGVSACPAECGPDQYCPTPSPLCDPVTTKACRPGPCAADADCASGMVCYAQDETTCPTATAPACAPGEKCVDPVVDAGACTTTTVRSCVPKYLVACHAAADCGEGFTCDADQECSCSGGGATGSPGATSGGGGANAGTGSAPSGTVAPVDAGDTSTSCTCTTLGTSHCTAKPMNCTTPSDCLTGWSCLTPPSATSGCAVAQVDGGTATCTPTPEPQPPSVCEPPYYDVVSSLRGGGKNASTGFTSGGADPATSGKGGSGGASGDNGGSGVTGGADDSHATGTGSTSATSGGGDPGGCQMGGSAGSAGGGSLASTGLLALLGALGVRRRRATAS